MSTPNQSDNEPNKPQVTFKLLETGQLTFEGDVSKETKELLQSLINASDYKTAKKSQKESDEIKARQRVDGVTLIFVGSMLAVAVFIISSALSAVNHALFPPQTARLVIHNYQ
ncbi:MAG: hypothetical protein PUP93_28570 [Rhizonema sp. NSF051]|nr:hypothetical protein [Rhizonema sp. NSF051]